MALGFDLVSFHHGTNRSRQARTLARQIEVSRFEGSFTDGSFTASTKDVAGTLTVCTGDSGTSNGPAGTRAHICEDLQSGKLSFSCQCRKFEVWPWSTA